MSSIDMTDLRSHQGTHAAQDGDGPGSRPVRRCIRCGREGRNAFRLVQDHAPTDLWICTHEEPCATRARQSRRAAARRAQGRPRHSPIAGLDLDDRRACVIGSDSLARGAIATALTDFASVDVESLDLSRRSIDLIGRREYGLVIADVRAADPVAMLDGLTRRLHGARRRGIPVIVSHDPHDDGPAIEALILRVAGRRITRPLDTSAIVSVLSHLPADGMESLAG